MRVLRVFVTTLCCLSAAFSTLNAAERYTVRRPMSPPPKPTAEPEKPKIDPVVPAKAELPWETDYQHARQIAADSSRLLLIYFHASENAKPAAAATCAAFEAVNLNDDAVRADVAPYVLLKLSMDAKIGGDDGTERTILSLPEFAEMAGRPGLTVVDFAHRETDYYGQTTGVLPFTKVAPTAAQTSVFLNLPPGPLTQRTLIYAVRIHRDRPPCTNGEPLPIVVQVAVDHAKYQAAKNTLGHQNFGARSQAVIKELGSGSPSEICARIPIGESIYDDAIQCMQAWRGSSGHWAIAKKPHKYYGFDMIKGKSGSWFAVGFFID